MHKTIALSGPHSRWSRQWNPGHKQRAPQQLWAPGGFLAVLSVLNPKFAKSIWVLPWRGDERLWNLGPGTTENSRRGCGGRARAETGENISNYQASKGHTVFPHLGYKRPPACVSSWHSLLLEKEDQEFRGASLTRTVILGRLEREYVWDGGLGAGPSEHWVWAARGGVYWAPWMSASSYGGKKSPRVSTFLWSPFPFQLILMLVQSHLNANFFPCVWNR